MCPAADCRAAAGVCVLTQPIELARTSTEAAIACPFIDGVEVASGSDAATEVIDPSIGRRRLLISSGCEGDVDRAVASGRSAFEDGRWSEAPLSLRKQVLCRFADLIANEAAALDLLDAQEMGKPVGERFGNAAAAAGLTRFYAEALDKLTGDTYPGDKHTFVVQRRVPRGVVAAVVPWNFPTYNAALKVAPALAAGNSIVLKPSELSTRSALRLAQLALRAGVPPGVLNVVPGLGETVGRALGLHRDVDMIAFTGSTEVGRRMLEYSGQSNMKVVLTECGGKSPHVVFDDGVDLDEVADTIANQLLVNQGQLCSVGSRLIVQRSLQRPLAERIVARFQRIVTGNATDPHTTFGPLASAKQCERVLGYIRSAQAEGAQVVGGRRQLESSGGYFVEPAIVHVSSAADRVAQEEIFGPVLCVIPFEREAEAVCIANGTIYGLAAYVWTSRLATGLRLAKSIRSTVFVNAAAPRGEGPGHACSAEPTRHSGIGVEGGLAGLESYQRRHLIWMNHT